MDSISSLMGPGAAQFLLFNKMMDTATTRSQQVLEMLPPAAAPAARPGELLL